MFNFENRLVRHCDGITRRGFLRAGSLGLGGFTFADLLRAEGASKTGSSNKAIIHIHLDGGPPQMDMIDPKPDAPAEIRGPFGTIPTKIPGVHLSELMPKCASIADRLVFLRSLVGADGQHNAFQCQSGFTAKQLQGMGGWPAMGCVINKLLGKTDDPVPLFVDLMQGRALVRDSARAGFLGPAFKAFRPDVSHLWKRELEDAMKGELQRRGSDHRTSMALIDDLNTGRLDDRLGLLKSLDGARRKVDDSGVAAMDRFNQQAFTMLTSGRFAEAMDLSKEDPKMLARYTPRIAETKGRFYTSEGPDAARKLLLARRLVEAGCRVVSLSISDFDTHSDNFPRVRDLVPIVDHAIWALVTDLGERGMLNDVTVLAWGEFGRTPKVNAKGGRDHWPKVAMGIMAGGGMPGGVVLGATDRIAAEATERPIHYQDVIATLYNRLGIDPHSATIDDPTGRPRHLVEHGVAIRELV